MVSRALAVVGAGALVLGTGAILLDLFGPSLPYTMPPMECALDSDEFLRFLSVVTDGTIRRCRITRLRNGREFYPAELEAIRSAQRSVNLEYYEFAPGEVGSAILEALVQRARAGVEVRLIVDAAGSLHTPDSWFEPLRKAGGQMRWYNPFRVQTWQRINNRTHRKLMTIDGTTGFIGGAGIADRWLTGTKNSPPWRDTVFRLEGDTVAGLVSTFSENWLECAGEILSGPKQFDGQAASDGPQGFVVISTPHGGGTQARILFQALIQSARKSLRITTPYFLPDHSARRALAEAARRGVEVQILTAGGYIDHPMVRRMSRESSRQLLEAGAEIFEYDAAMIHAKLLTVDEQWSVVGSANFDHRSFALNDEVNLAVLDRELAETIEADFRDDLRESQRLTLKMLGKRTVLEREIESLEEALRRES